MASGFFAILDDIGALMDDVAVTTKLAAGKTAGILGDDLAVNAEKATGFLSSRELPVLWSITKGSLFNKVIIVPVALLLSAILPVAITVLLVCGGVYLAYEGVEKILEYLFHSRKEQPQVIQAAEQENPDAEKTKIKAAVMTDFILSIEIVIIALGAVEERSLTVRILTVSAVSVLATIGVYGIVALIVRMDDAGLRLIRHSKAKSFLAMLGNLLVASLPVIIKMLGIVGTIALILVSGGIFVHHISWFHDLFPDLIGIVKEMLFGLAFGLTAVALVKAAKRALILFK
jgi:predicted DNA repair protein MutK